MRTNAPKGDTFCACGNRLGLRNRNGRCAGCAAKQTTQSSEWRACMAAGSDARKRAGQSRTATMLAWCPAERRAEYLHMLHACRFSAAEAKAIILADEERLSRAQARRVEHTV